MKKYCWFGHRGPVVLAAFGVLLSSMLVPAAHAQPGQLIIHRTPNFGTQAWLRIWIDGIQFPAVAMGHDFRAPIPPGPHVIGVLRVPERWPSERPTFWPLKVRPGRTYEFTALVQDEHVVLRESGR